MQEITVTLGGRPYTVKQLPMRPEANWRKKLQEQLAPIVDLIANYNQIELNTPADVVGILQRITPALLNAPDIMLDLVLAYSPALMMEREWIADNAYSQEVMDALLAVVRLAYPFEPLLKMAQRYAPKSGSAPQPSKTTSTS